MQVLSYGDPSILNGDSSKFTLMSNKRRCDDCNDCGDCGMDFSDCDNFSMCGWNSDPSVCNWYDEDEDD